MYFWASMVQLDGDKEPKQRILCRKNKGFFMNFTKAQVYLEKDNHVIDSTMVYDDGVYYRFSKDETTKNIKTDTAPDLNKESFYRSPCPKSGGNLWSRGTRNLLFRRSEKVVSDH